MRNSFILLCLAVACLTSSIQAAVYRRGDKISENFKQLDLDPAEIDPNVAPLGPNKVEVLEESSTDDILNASADNEILDEADETAAAVMGENEIIDESANEIVQSVATAAPAVATTAAPAAAAPAVSEAATPVKGEEEPSGLAKYCKCTNNYCDCCRTFNLPFIPVKGPGCARMTYLGNEKMSISLKYGDLTLASRTVSSKRARPICVGLPGGYSQFCGRVYGLSKEKKENFKACLGFELRADDEVEAALRVSCFKFGPEGLRVAEAEPLPVEANKEEEDDDDDIFGFGAGGDDDEDEDDYEEDDEEEEEPEDDDADADYADDDAEEEAPADADYGGFSLAGLLDELDDEDDEDSKPSTTPVVAPENSATRTAVVSAQSKDEKGTAAAAVPTAVADSTETVAPAATAAVVTTAAEQVTPAPESSPDTTAKTKKSKKGKKNKKKKAADTEGDFAYEFLNGLLDFFN